MNLHLQKGKESGTVALSLLLICISLITKAMTYPFMVSSS